MLASAPRQRRIAGKPGLRGEADRGVGGTEAGIAAPLHDLEKEPAVEIPGVGLEVLGIASTGGHWQRQAGEFPCLLQRRGTAGSRASRVCAARRIGALAAPKPA